MLAVSRPVLLSKVNEISNKDDLITKLQRALMIEFSTIPPYLTAMYSIMDNSNYAYRLFRSVVLEEMLHMNLVCNLLNGIGGHPQFAQNPDFPIYPTGLPGQKPGEGPLLQLVPVSIPLIQNTFMAIEEPARKHARPEDDNYQTIAQFYMSIRDGFITVQNQIGHDALFTDTGFQKMDSYFGSGGGKLVYVKDIESALHAISEIVEQGEGAPGTDSPTIPNEPYGSYDAYGERPDGTFGPLVRTTEEQSHFYKFMDVAKGMYPLGNVYPMLPNPVAEAFESSAAKQLAEILNGCYGIMVRGLETTFNSKTEPDPFFTVVFAMMQGIIPSLSVQLMQMPAGDYIDPAVGPNAGPTFRYVYMTLDEIVSRAETLLQEISKQKGTDALQNTVTATLRTLHGIQEKVKAFKLGFL